MEILKVPRQKKKRERERERNRDVSGVINVTVI